MECRRLLDIPVSDMPDFTVVLGNLLKFICPNTNKFEKTVIIVSFRWTIHYNNCANMVHWRILLNKVLILFGDDLSVCCASELFKLKLCEDFPESNECIFTHYKL